MKFYIIWYNKNTKHITVEEEADEKRIIEINNKLKGDDSDGVRYTSNQFMDADITSLEYSFDNFKAHYPDSVIKMNIDIYYPTGEVENDIMIIVGNELELEIQKSLLM